MLSQQFTCGLVGLLQLIFELKGHPSQKWLKKGQFKDEHFAEDGKFKFEEVDKITKMVHVAMPV
jgi:hypothetical protein